MNSNDSAKKDKGAGADGKMWGGRFAEATAASVERFTASIHFDARLFRHDIAGSSAHARMLAQQGLISDQERDLILDGLAGIQTEIEADEFEFRLDLEDIHMHIEHRLVEIIGPAGAKLHTARSRNDQVALDLRLYLREEIDRMTELLTAMQQALVRLARQNVNAVMPGYTHLQRAQPVLVGHHLLAYEAMFRRDIDRLADCRKRLNVLPLGAAALAGTGLPIDRDFVARELGFAAVSDNSMDTVADRDFVVEFIGVAALIQIHLSRMAEELVLWSSQEFNFIKIDDAFCTGSSIMPQKKNPDIPELVRGKSGRVVGHLMAVLTLLKGLPMTYNRDLQEDKEPVFDTVDTVAGSLAIMAEMLGHIRFNIDTMARATATGYMTATDLADYLVQKEIPFRQAHAIVGQTVAYCIAQKKELEDLSLDELQHFSKAIDDDVFRVLSVAGSLASRYTRGGTAPKTVAEALCRAEKRLGLVA